jgi:hypothetical protein
MLAIIENFERNPKLAVHYLLIISVFLTTRFEEILQQHDFLDQSSMRIEALEQFAFSAKKLDRL